MSNVLAELQERREKQSLMIMTMEKKLNPNSWALFKYFNRSDKNIAKISTAQYWDWLTYIDDDYLTDYEVLKMKELYHRQLQELSGQFVAHSLVGWFMCYPLCGPIVKGPHVGWMLRLPFALTFATFLGVQASAWERKNKTFHELISQPAPHGSYLRRTCKEHFPVWWANVSADLHQSGYSLPEMNEYDKATELQKSHTQFDAQIL